MHPLTHSATHPDMLPGLLAMVAFGAYHGLNPGMGWLFALSLGLQKNSGRAIWVSMLPISAGHAVSIALVAGIVILAGQLISLTALQLVTALLLLAFGVFKLARYYRHPKWVGMNVGMRDLFFWSFLMAVAHGAGLMVAPILIGMMNGANSAEGGVSSSAIMSLGVFLHTLAMLTVMGAVAWIVYKKLGLMFLKRSWVNFDLIWAGALLLVGGFALYSVVNA